VSLPMVSHNPHVDVRAFDSNMDTDVSQMLEPHDDVIQLADKHTWVGHVIVGFTTLSVVGHFCCIMISTLLSANFRASARNADMWRLVLNHHTWISVVDIMFMVGNLARFQHEAVVQRCSLNCIRRFLCFLLWFRHVLRERQVLQTIRPCGPRLER
jgi:hypothetical protein